MKNIIISIILLLSINYSEAQSIFGLTDAENDLGSIFKYDIKNDTFSIAYEIERIVKGIGPEGNLIELNGKIYGFTTKGGDYDHGVFYEFDNSTNTYKEKINFDRGRGQKLFLINNTIFHIRYMSPGCILFKYDFVLNKFDSLNVTSCKQSNQGSVLLNKENIYGVAYDEPHRNGYIYSINLNTYETTNEYIFENLKTRGGLIAYEKKLYGTVDYYLYEWDPIKPDTIQILAELPLKNDNLGGNDNLIIHNNIIYIMSTKNNGGLFSWDKNTNTIKTLKIFSRSNHLEGYSPRKMSIYKNKLYVLMHDPSNVIFQYDLENNTQDFIRFPIDRISNDYIFSFLLYDDYMYVTASGGDFKMGSLFQYNLISKTKKSLVNFGLNKGRFNGSGQSGSKLVTYNDKIYGLTKSGGANNEGTLFRFDPVTNEHKVIYDFPYRDGFPDVGLVVYNNKLYGATEGGLFNPSDAYLFEYDPDNNSLKKLYQFNNELVNNIYIFNGKIYAVVITLYSKRLLLKYDISLESLDTVMTKEYSNENHFDWGSSFSSQLLLHNNKLYGGTYKKIHEFDPLEETIKDLDLIKSDQDRDTKILFEYKDNLFGVLHGSIMDRKIYEIDLVNEKIIYKMDDKWFDYNVYVDYYDYVIHNDIFYSGHSGTLTSINLENETHTILHNSPNANKSMSNLILYHSDCSEVIISDDFLPDAKIENEYYYKLNTSLQDEYYKWKLIGGRLPDEFTLNSKTGEISGAPLTPGNFEFSVGYNYDNCGVSKNFNINVLCNDIVILDESLPNALIEIPYYYKFKSSPIFNSYKWKITGGRLPDGLTLNSETGELNGNPVTPGSYEFTIGYINDNCGSSKTYKIIIYDPNSTENHYSVQTTIYPNPGNGSYNLTIAENYQIKRANISIVNLLGNQVYQKEIDQNQISFQLPKKIKSGVYILVISNQNNEKITKKLIVE